MYVLRSLPPSSLPTTGRGAVVKNRGPLRFNGVAEELSDGIDLPYYVIRKGFYTLLKMWMRYQCRDSLCPQCALLPYSVRCRRKRRRRQEKQLSLRHSYSVL
ncbi:hypothetical protein VUR80DRAFT_7797 [Thermomyces stellatus]